MSRFPFRYCFFIVLLTSGISAQQPRSASNTGQIPPAYMLVPGDQVAIRVANAEEFNDRTFRVDDDGFITVPLAGRIKAAGLTAAQLEASMVTSLEVYFREPAASVSIVQGSPEPVFLVGQFKSPGLYPLQPGETLVRILTDSGGLQPNASRVIRLTRRKEQGPIPLPNTRANLDGSTSAEISLSTLQNNLSPAEGLALRPFDVILVDRAEVIYVSGNVGKPGTVELGDRDFVSLIKVITLSGGLTKDASRKIRVLRPIMDTARRAEIEIDVDKVFRGEVNDFPLLPNDVLFVPTSGSRVALNRTSTIALSLGLAVVTSLAIGLH